MNKQQAQMQATRETLRALVKDSPYTAKYVASQVGEEYTTFVHRLRGERPTYKLLDTAFVVNVLAVLDVPLSVFFTQVEERSEELLRSTQA
ncbi:hypothetical protein J2X63_003224 [Agromyces sp. 3263]|uniref:hypothetical protein n=1 Tax=Agromyces sp. 3263 TaxID=2817750 RepID=UPI0028591BF3|nr:hypothetical protein [Agromyces sp. 3263]MDR6907516.1 hypothetical protein [Agromyces sp. 3263]